MDRYGFCELMRLAKNNQGISTLEVSCAMRVLQPNLRRFEKGESNFNMVMVLEYLSVFKSELVISDEILTVFCTDYGQLVHWLVSERQLHNYSQIDLAKNAGISKTIIEKVESQKSRLNIDNFLKIAQVFGCDIDIRPCGEQTDNK